MLLSISCWAFTFAFLFIISLFMQIRCQPRGMAIDQTIFQKPLKPLKSHKAVFLMSTPPEKATYQEFVRLENIKKIQQINANSNKSFTLQVNQFASLTEKQVKQLYLGLIPSEPVSIAFARALNEATKPIIQVQRKTQASLVMAMSEPIFNLDQAIPQASPFMASSPSKYSLQQSRDISATLLEGKVLQIAKNFFKQNKELPDTEIQNKIIPTYKFNGDLSKITVPASGLQDSQPRLLQQLEKGKARQLIKDVDWSCISGRVKAQGNCGACYAISTLDNVAAVLGIYHMTFFVQLSAQQIVDCASNSLTYGCQGGFMEGTFHYMMSQGVYTSYTYPYTSADYSRDDNTTKRTCFQYRYRDQTRWKIQNFYTLKKGSCDSLAMTLQKHPISVAIAGYPLIFYKSGVFDACRNEDKIDHAVLLVGFKAGVGWKIKNSWGIRWGQNGYGWLKEGNTCKICESAMHPIPTSDFGADNYFENRYLKTCPPPEYAPEYQPVTK